MSRYRQIGGKTALLHASIGPMTIPAELIAETSLEFPCPPLGAAELTAPEAERMAGMFKALADPTRRAILARLARGEATVMELAKPFAMSQPAISKHLKVLEGAGLISRGRDAQRQH